MRRFPRKLVAPTGFVSHLQRRHGFTLIEMMITLAIAAILLTLAAPSFGDLILNQRIKAASFDLMSTLTYARSEAIKRGANVSITPAGGDWKNGWTIEVGGAPLRTQHSLSDIAITGAPPSVTYTRDGRLPVGTAAAVFEMKYAGTNPNVTSRCISIDPGGRPNSKKGACS